QRKRKTHTCVCGRIVARHRPQKGCETISRGLKPRTLPCCLAKLNNWRRKALVRVVTKNPALSFRFL
uniref:Uncharacterized protein n=1 Tax=Lates calcarifer TaxID=8187 RepID=A0A4W6CMA8_LATCA